jgi:Cys-tRNA(Pro)/Cys-tRNA(Cys) deacylase
MNGMRAGGISALGLRRPNCEIYLDESARTLDVMHVSAGQRGIDLALRVEDLVSVTHARYVRAV